MKAIVIIPARYGSTRFPGKPLALISGVPMIIRVCKQVEKASGNITFAVATDNKQIADLVVSEGYRVVMTDSKISTGTERCFVAAENMQTEFDVVVNVQGDEPFILPEQIEAILNSFEDDGVQIASLMKKIDSAEGLFNSNWVKVVVDKNRNAILFSRQPIPFIRGVEHTNWLNSYQYYRHIGVYAFRGDIIKQIRQLEVSELETAESLEQLTWIYNGYKIKMIETAFQSPAIDIPEDVNAVENFLKTNPDFI